MQEAEAEREGASETRQAHEATQRSLTEAHVRIAVLEDAARFAEVKQDGCDNATRNAEHQVASLRDENEALKQRIAHVHNDLKQARCTTI